MREKVPPLTILGQQMCHLPPVLIDERNATHSSNIGPEFIKRNDLYATQSAVAGRESCKLEHGRTHKGGLWV